MAAALSCRSAAAPLASRLQLVSHHHRLRDASRRPLPSSSSNKGLVDSLNSRRSSSVLGASWPVLQRQQRHSYSTVRRCIGPDDECTLEPSSSFSPEEHSAGDSMDVQPVLVEDIQQQVQQEEEAIEQEQQQLVMATAVSTDGGRMENALLSVNGWPMIDMDPETSSNFWSLMGVLALASYQFFSVDAGMARGWSAQEFFFRTCLDNWRIYEHYLHTSPILTKALTSCSIYAFCDWLAQSIKNKNALRFDKTSIAHNAMIGLLAHGPMSHFWYMLSDSVIPYVQTWYGWIPKMAADQTVYVFAWNVLYMALIGRCKGQDPETIMATIRKMWWPLQREGWKFWPFVHIITYNFIPCDERVLWVDMVELVWVVAFISILENTNDKEAENEGSVSD